MPIRARLLSFAILMFFGIPLASGSDYFDCDLKSPSEVGKAVSEIDLPAAGAHRFTDILYQRCDAHTLTVPNDFELSGFNEKKRLNVENVQRRQMNEFLPDEFFNMKKVRAPGSHFYLKESYPEECTDLRKAPPVNHLGGRPGIQKERGGELLMNFHNRNWVKPGTKGTETQQSKFVFLECSGVISGFHMAANLKMSKKGSLFEQTQSTTQALEQQTRKPKDPNSCFERVIFEKGRGFRSGDTVLFRKPNEAVGHAIMIDTAGTDPFGIDSISSVDDCDRSKIDPSRFDFTVMHAASRMPVIRVSGTDFTASSYYGSLMLIMAEQACRAQFGPLDAEISVKNDESSTLVRAIRHVGMKDRECMYEKPVRIKGEECLKNCSPQHSKQQ